MGTPANFGDIQSDKKPIEYGIFTCSDTTTGMNLLATTTLDIDGTAYADSAWGLEGTPGQIHLTNDSFALVEIHISVAFEMADGGQRPQPLVTVKKNGSTTLAGQCQATYMRNTSGVGTETTANFTVFDTAPADNDYYEIISERNVGNVGDVRLISGENQFIFKAIR